MGSIGDMFHLYSYAQYVCIFVYSKMIWKESEGVPGNNTFLNSSQRERFEKEHGWCNSLRQKAHAYTATETK